MTSEELVAGQHAVRVFLSHAAADREFARRLREDLSAANIQVWDDEEILDPGDSIQAELAAAINSADAVLILISQAASRSPWMTRELAHALTTKVENPQLRIVPVLIEKGAELPFVLRDLVYVDLSSPQAYKQNLPSLLHALHTKVHATTIDELAREYLSEDLIQSINDSQIQQDLIVHSERAARRIGIALLLVLLLSTTGLLVTFSLGGGSNTIVTFIGGSISGALLTVLLTLTWERVRK